MTFALDANILTDGFNSASEANWGFLKLMTTVEDSTTDPFRNTFLFSNFFLGSTAYHVSPKSVDR